MDITLKNITLSYSYKSVLRGITHTFEGGKIHALLGENGAGKSTLLKIITGALKPDSGTIFLNDKKTVFKSPRDALIKGIACVYQRPYLSDSLTVMDNLRIGNPNAKSSLNQFPFIKNFLPPLYLKAERLTPDQRFFTALASALIKNPSILILDEPTALLNDEMSRKLFELLKQLAENGKNIIVITHVQRDLAWCNTVTRIVEGVIEKNARPENMGAFETDYTKLKKHLDAKDCFQIRKNEGIKAGIIPSDRTYLASNPDLTIEELLCATFHGTKKQRRTHAEKLIASSGVNIKISEKAGFLSGGMLQKLILERELFSKPEKLYIDEPYQGLDVESCRRLKERFDRIEKDGCEIIFK